MSTQADDAMSVQRMLNLKLAHTVFEKKVCSDIKNQFNICSSDN